MRKGMAILIVFTLVFSAFVIIVPAAIGSPPIKPQTKLTRKDPEDEWKPLKGKPWGDFHVENLYGEFEARVHIVGAQGYSWYLITLYSEHEATGDKLGSVGYYGLVEKDCWADIGLVQCDKKGQGTFYVPCDGPTDPYWGDLLAPSLLLGEYIDVDVHVKWVGTGDEPDWGLVATGGSSDPDVIRDNNLYSEERISFDVWDEVNLVEKNPSTWEIIYGGAYGILRYDTVNSVFDFTFEGYGLEPLTEYSLIYYADRPNRFVNWGGDNPGAHIMTGGTDEFGYISLGGEVELNMDLPHPDDYNYWVGAKIWLVPSADYDVGMKKVTNWNPTEFLFETDLIHYDDTDVANLATLTVDIGTTSSETQAAVFNFAGWGPIEPTTHGGNWGGFGGTGETCRVIWAPSESPDEEWIPDNAAVIKISTYPFGSCDQDLEIEIRVLDGIADDSFTIYEVEAEDSWDELLHYNDMGSTETWKWHTISLEINPGMLFLLIQADGDAWSGWTTYGQVGVDQIEITST